MQPVLWQKSTATVLFTHSERCLSGNCYLISWACICSVGGSTACDQSTWRLASWLLFLGIQFVCECVQRVIAEVHTCASLNMCIGLHIFILLVLNFRENYGILYYRKLAPILKCLPEGYTYYHMPSVLITHTFVQIFPAS